MNRPPNPASSTTYTAATVGLLNYAAGQKLTMDGSAKPVTLPMTRLLVRIANAGDVTIWFRADGQAAVAEAAGSEPIGPGEKEDIVIAGTALSIIGASGDVYVKPYA